MSAERQKCLKILGLSSSATAEDIKKSYRKMALQYHPDKNDDADANAQFQQISYAYKYLTDGPEGLSDTNNDHPDDFFHQMFTDMFFSQFVFRSGRGYFTSPFGFSMESDDDDNYDEYFGFNNHMFFHSDSEDDYGPPPPCNHAYGAGCTHRSSTNTPRYEAPEPKISKKRLRRLEKRKRQRERQKEKKKTERAPKPKSGEGTNGKEKTNSTEGRSSADNTYPTGKADSSGKTNTTEKADSAEKVEADGVFRGTAKQADSKDNMDKKEKSQQTMDEEKLRQREKKRQEGEEKRKREQEAREIAASVLKKQREKQEREKEKRKEKDKKAAAEKESDGMSGWFYEDTSRSKKSKEKDKEKPEETVHSKQAEETVHSKQAEETVHSKQAEETVNRKQPLTKNGSHYEERSNLSKDTEESEKLRGYSGLYSSNSKHNNSNYNNRTKGKTIYVGKDGSSKTKSGAKQDYKKAQSKTESKFRNRFDILEDLEDNESDASEEYESEDEEELENKPQTVQGKTESDYGVHPDLATNISQEDVDRKDGYQASNDTNTREKYQNFGSQYHHNLKKQGNRQNVGYEHFDKRNTQKNERKTQENSQNIDYKYCNDSTTQRNSQRKDDQHAKKMNNYPRGKPSFEPSVGRRFQDKQNYGESINHARWSDAKQSNNKPSTPFSHDNKEKSTKPSRAMSESAKGSFARSDNNKNNSRATPQSQRVFYNSKIKSRQTHLDDVEKDVTEKSSLYNSGRSHKVDSRNWTDHRNRESTTNNSSSARSNETNQRFAYNGPNNDSVNNVFGSGVTAKSKTPTKDCVNNRYGGKSVAATNKTPTKDCLNNVFGSEDVSATKKTQTNLQDSDRNVSAQAMPHTSDNERIGNNSEHNPTELSGFNKARNPVDHASKGSGRRTGNFGSKQTNGKTTDHHATKCSSSASSRRNKPQYSYDERNGTHDQGKHNERFTESVDDEKDKGNGEGNKVSGSYNGIHASNEGYLAENFSNFPGTYISRNRAFRTSENDDKGFSDRKPKLKGKYEHELNRNHLNERKKEVRENIGENIDKSPQAKPERCEANIVYSYPTKPPKAGVVSSNPMENKNFSEGNVGYTDYDMMQGNWYPNKSNSEFHPTNRNAPNQSGRFETNPAESKMDNFKATHGYDPPENGRFSPHISSHNRLYYQRDAPPSFEQPSRSFDDVGPRDAPPSFEQPSRPFNGVGPQDAPPSFEQPSRPFNDVGPRDANYNVAGYTRSSHSNNSYYSSYPNDLRSGMDDNQNFGNHHYPGMNFTNGFHNGQSNITGSAPSSHGAGYNKLQKGVNLPRGHDSKTTTNPQWIQQGSLHASNLKGSNRNSNSDWIQQDSQHYSNLYGSNHNSIPDNHCSAHNELDSSHTRNNPSHVKLRPDIGDNISDVSSSLDSLDDACLDSFPSVPIGQFKHQTSNHSTSGSVQFNAFGQPMNQQVPYTYYSQQTPPSSDYRVNLDYGYDFGLAGSHIGIHETLLLNDRVKNYYKQ